MFAAGFAEIDAAAKEIDRQAKDDERAFLKTKIDYQTANIKAIEEVLKIEAMEKWVFVSIIFERPAPLRTKT